MENISHKYDDIINLPHHVSKKHPQMSLHDRAAQFSPFAALTGHKAAINETARLTDEKQTKQLFQSSKLAKCKAIFSAKYINDFAIYAMKSKSAVIQKLKIPCISI